MEQLLKTLKELNIKFIENEPMANRTTFKVGGNARVMAFPKSEEEIIAIINSCNDNSVRFIAVGNGSNLLVSDNGIDACVICLGKDFSEIRLIDDETVFAESGASLMKLCRFALENGLSGLEFAYGIPGSCGGAAFMNAGAYGGEMKDVLVSVDVLTKEGKILTLQAEELKLGYRTSIVPTEGYIVLSARIALSGGKKDEIRAKMEELREKRVTKQPLEYPSAGSTFKRPEGYFAGKLIQDTGLKGFSVGGAQVSEKHCGFVINTGNATAADVQSLIGEVIDRVRKTTNVTLEPEVKQIGEF